MSNIQLITGRPLQSILAADDASPASTAKGADPVSLVPEPSATMVSDDAITALARLLAQLDEESRTSARANEAAQNVARAKEDAAQVQAMRQKADDLRGGGLAAGLTAIGVGAAQLCASAASIRASNADLRVADATRTASELAKVGDQASRAASRAFEVTAKMETAASASAKTFGAAFSAGASGMQATGKIMEGQFQGAQADDDADAKVHANAASAYERAAKAAHDEASDAKDSLNKVLAWVKEMHAAQSGAQLTAASSVRG